jgi:hypothetical protein
MMAKWVKSWMVTSSKGDRKYKVSYGDDSSWGCSCSAWKYRRDECRHIREIIKQVGRTPSVADSPYEKPLYILSDEVSVPVFEARTNELRIPNGYPDNRMDHEWLETHICSMMLDNGFSIREIRSIRGLDDSWTTKKIAEDFKRLGEFCPTSWTPVKSRDKKRKKANSMVRELMLIE